MIPSQANVKEAFPRMYAMGWKEQAVDEIDRLMSLAHDNKLAHDPGVPRGATLALNGAV